MKIRLTFLVNKSLSDRLAEMEWFKVTCSIAGDITAN